MMDIIIFEMSKVVKGMLKGKRGSTFLSYMLINDGKQDPSLSA